MGDRNETRAQTDTGAAAPDARSSHWWPAESRTLKTW